MASRQHQVPKRQAQAYQRLLGLQPIEREHYGESVPDGQNARFVAEYKARAKAPFVIREAMEQVEGYMSRDDERFPLVLFHRIGDRHTEDLVVMRVRHFRELIRQLGLFADGG